MKLLIDLDPIVFERLARQAHKTGLPIESAAAHCVKHLFELVDELNDRRRAELVARAGLSIPHLPRA